MSEIEAAAVAGFRDNLERCPDQLGFMSADDIRSLLDALEKARGELDHAIRSMSEWARQAGFAKGALEASKAAGMIDEWRSARDTAIGERDSARALLGELLADDTGGGLYDFTYAVRARIAKELGQ